MFTIAQISAILGLLLAFSVPQDTVNTVQSILEGHATSSIQIIVPAATSVPTPAPSLQVTAPAPANSGGESGNIPAPQPTPPAPPQVLVNNYALVANTNDGTWAQALASFSVSSTDTSVATNKVYLQTNSATPISLSIGGAGQLVRNTGTSTLTAFGNLTGTSTVSLNDGLPAGSYTVTIVGIGYLDANGYKEVLGLSLPITFTLR